MAESDIIRTSITDQIFDTIKDRIERNEYLPSDRLPSETELAKSFNVSRMTMRTALQKLVAYGLLEAKNGGGYYVMDFKLSNVIKNVSGLMMNNITYKDFNQYRSLIETESLKLLKGKPINPNDLKALRKSCDAMKIAAEKESAIDFAKADYSFHMQICKMSGNAMFIYSYEMIGTMFMEYLAGMHYESDKLKEIPEYDNVSNNYYYLRAIDYHMNIIDDIRIGNLDNAIEIIRKFTHTELEN